MTDTLREEIEREMRKVSMSLMSVSVDDAPWPVVGLSDAVTVAVRIARNRAQAAEEVRRLVEEALAKAERERDEAREWAVRSVREVEARERLLTCVACGQEFPPGTPTSQHDLLYDHARVCEKHPLRAAERALAEEREQRSKDASLMKEALRDKALNDFQIRVVAGLLFDPATISAKDMAWAMKLSCAPPPAAEPARCPACGSDDPSIPRPMSYWPDGDDEGKVCEMWPCTDPFHAPRKGAGDA